ncbi:MAG: metallophosphoesterase [Oscillospiraceae bacterium]|nr:metallophosphoesterase [Oscillospiraceae bacterium]
MLKKIKRNFWNIVCVIWAVAIALFWFAMRVIWSGISKVLFEAAGLKEPTEFFMNLPLYINILLWMIAAFALLKLVRRNRKKGSTALLTALLIIFTIASAVVVIMGAVDYLYFIVPKFILSMLIALCIGAFAALLFFPPVRKNTLSAALKWALIALIIIMAVFEGYGVTLGSRFTYEPVVYAVEDTYQIVFSTNHSAAAWVEVGGESYYELYAGSMKSNDNVHKITVPQEKLDGAKSYSIHAEKMIYRGPFGGFKGKEISKEYSFRPVNSADGLVYYTMTDVHHARDGAVAAAKAVENLDFLVILGDSVGMMDYESDVQFSNLLAHDVTGGEIPVVYSRGNHEIKGAYGETLYKYVGSKGESFYYYFTLSDVFGINLDLGEDHDDGWWEYYGTDRFTLYHNEQTKFLTALAESKPYEDYNYTLVTCHIPIQFVNSRFDHDAVKADWTAILNSIAPDLAVYGHQHDLYPFLVGQDTMYNAEGELIYNSRFVGSEGKTYGGYLTDYTFNGFIAGRRGTAQVDELSPLNREDHVGMAVYVDLANNTQTCKYINTAGEIVSVYNPFVEGPAQSEFVLELK